MSTQHLAAILPSKEAGALSVSSRPTPTPGPKELLIEVSSIALNPIDYYMRDFGFALSTFPAVIGSDIAGTVIAAGSSVASDAPKVGTRVAAFAPCFFRGGTPDYGAFQKKVLVPAVAAVALPEKLSFNEAALLPMAVQTSWAGWYSIGLPRDLKYKAGPNQGVLVWGGASSVGSVTIQTANLLGFKVYATASAKHHDYLKGLVASKLFDYKDPNVVEKVVRAAKEDGVTLSTGYDAAGSLKEIQEILKQTKGVGVAKIASAIPLSDESPKTEGVETVFVAAPTDEAERMDFSHFVFGVWLKEKLEKGELVPSPSIKVIDGGLEGLNNGLDELKKGVSGVKLVLEI